MKRPLPAYKGSRPYTFVSYSHADEDEVYAQIRWLQDRGINVWYDTTGIGAGNEWNDEIAKAIKDADRFLFFITRNSAASEHCRRELNFAQSEGRQIVVCHLQETELPDGLRLSLDNRQAILKHRLARDDYESSLLGALSADRTFTTVPTAQGKLPPVTHRLRLGAIAGLLALFAVGAFWLWQRAPDERASSDTAMDSRSPLTAIAVLPFDDLSPDADHAWLAAGMAEDLIEALGRIDALHVPARRSTAVVKDTGADLATIGEKLGVGSVVEGSVRRVGDELNVVARWVRVEDGARLWSARFDRQLDDVFAIQKEITVGIAEAIRAELGIEDASALMLRLRYATSDVRAWELLKKAAAMSETLEPARVAEAKELLRRAIEYDPKFVAAHVQLALIEYQSGDFDQGVEQFKNVLRMDPSQYPALALFAYDSAMRFWDFETAERLLRRIPDNEKNVRTLGVEWNVFVSTGRLEEALSAAQRAVRLDPMWARAHCNLGHSYHWLGDLESALLTYERAMAVQEETEQGNAWCGWYLISVYHRLERESEIVPLLLRLTPPHLHEKIRRGWASGGWEGTMLALAGPAPSNNCLALAEAGAVERMLACLGAGIDETGLDKPMSSAGQLTRHALMLQLRVDSRYAPYRNHPRFQELLRRLDERVQRAAGTYEQRVGVQLSP